MSFRVRKLSLLNWNPFKNKIFDVDSDVVVFSGPNESGKTSIAEAIIRVLFGKNIKEKVGFRKRNREDVELVVVENGEETFYTTKSKAIFEGYPVRSVYMKLDDWEEESGASDMEGETLKRLRKVLWESEVDKILRKIESEIGKDAKFDKGRLVAKTKEFKEMNSFLSFVQGDVKDKLLNLVQIGGKMKLLKEKLREVLSGVVNFKREKEKIYTDSNIENLRQAFENFKSAVQNFKNQKDAFESKVQRLKSEIDRTKKSLADTVAEIEKLEKDMTSLKGDRKIVSEIVDELESIKKKNLVNQAGTGKKYWSLPVMAFAGSLIFILVYLILFHLFGFYASLIGGGAVLTAVALFWIGSFKKLKSKLISDMSESSIAERANHLSDVFLDVVGETKESLKNKNEISFWESVKERVDGLLDRMEENLEKKRNEQVKLDGDIRRYEIELDNSERELKNAEDELSKKKANLLNALRKFEVHIPDGGDDMNLMSETERILKEVKEKKKFLDDMEKVISRSREKEVMDTGDVESSESFSFEQGKLKSVKKMLDEFDNLLAQFSNCREELKDYLGGYSHWENVLSVAEQKLAEFEDDMREYEDVFNEYAAGVFLKMFLEDAKRKIDDELLELIEESGDYIKRWTGKEIKVILDGKRINLNLGGVSEKNLSTGTKSQIYIAVRMAMAKRIFEKKFGGSGFVIMDDVLLTSDKDRRSKILDAFKSLVSDGWQILFFTHDENIANSVKGIANGKEVKHFKLTAEKK